MDRQQNDDFLIVGAGLAGLAFASDMKARGATVRLLDKGRGAGGRMATRRLTADGITAAIDHGAQFFTARGERLKAIAQSGLEEGWLGVWSHGFPLWKGGAIIDRPPGHPRYAPFAGMNDLAKRLAGGLDIITGSPVVAMERTGQRYAVRTEDGRTFSGSTLILNLPPAQLLNLARNLLMTASISEIETVEFLPAWAMLALLEEDIAGAEWPAIEFDTHPVLGWLARDHTKRLSPAPPTLVAHGSGEWSSMHLEEDTTTIQETLLQAVTDVVGMPDIRTIQVHRWRYAQPVWLLDRPYLWEATSRIGCCGDWCGSSRVEGALESGWRLAEAVCS